MKTYEVECQNGESILNPGKMVHYMLAVIDINGKEVELYAEEEQAKNNKQEAYAKLKQEIIVQARDYGIPEDALRFIHDGSGK